MESVSVELACLISFRFKALVAGNHVQVWPPNSLECWLWFRCELKAPNGLDSSPQRQFPAGRSPRDLRTILTK